jgi:hypothetical protein
MTWKETFYMGFQHTNVNGWNEIVNLQKPLKNNVFAKDSVTDHTVGCCRCAYTDSNLTALPDFCGDKGTDDEEFLHMGGNKLNTYLGWDLIHTIVMVGVSSIFIPVIGHLYVFCFFLTLNLFSYSMTLSILQILVSEFHGRIRLQRPVQYSEFHNRRSYDDALCIRVWTCSQGKCPTFECPWYVVLSMFFISPSLSLSIHTHAHTHIGTIVLCGWLLSKRVVDNTKTEVQKISTKAYVWVLFGATGLSIFIGPFLVTVVVSKIYVSPDTTDVMRTIIAVFAVRLHRSFFINITLIHILYTYIYISHLFHYTGTARVLAYLYMWSI